MLNSLQKFIEDNNLFSKNTQLLVAVSGGMDSMVLLNALFCLGYRLGVCHVNHSLRGDESDTDEQFVREFCHNNDIPFYLHTIKWHNHSGSIQEISRNIRYEYFEKIRKEFGYKYILTAHHRDDSMETFFINAIRGSGLSGLTGIPMQNNKIIRPFSDFYKDEIRHLSDSKKWTYRVDKSNEEIKYRRNFIRNEVLVDLDKHIPDYRKGLSRSISNLHAYDSLLEEVKNNILKEHKSRRDELIIISKDFLNDYTEIDTLLFLILKEYGFTSSDIKQLSDSINRVGVKFFSKKYILSNRRNHFEIVASDSLTTEVTHFKIEGIGMHPIFDENNIDISELNEFGNLDDPNIEFIPAEIIDFPLSVRRWKKGDSFHPFGMNGMRKKLKKFFVDKKLSPYEKSKVQILTYQDKIIWILGMRLDNRFSIKKKYSSYYKLEYIKGVKEYRPKVV